MQHHPTALVILDGFGFSKNKTHNAIAQAKTPHLDQWFSEYPHANLRASGEAVGLPKGYIGNSEVGHSTIGAGRIIKQPLALINEAIATGNFFTNKKLVAALEQLQKSGAPLHIMGLLSDAGVHSHIDHFFAFLDAAAKHKIKHIIIHPILDGRDTLPKSAALFLTKLEQKIATMPQVKIGSLQGRYYAMDRDKNWDRTEQSYRMLTEHQPVQTRDWKKVLEQAYKKGLTDEFIPPTPLTDYTIQPGDGIIVVNFRPERLRQLADAFENPHFNHFRRAPLNLSFFITPLPYNDKNNQSSLFSLPIVENTLLDVLEQQHKSIFIIAETEKYAHVTYFFSGGREEKRPNEKRVLIPSIKAKTYENYPCMSAVEITDALLHSLQSDPCDFYVINYANADMVAHSGNFDATVKAIECLDTQLARLYNQIIEKMNGTMYITADHGNAEELFDEATQQPKTAHTTNLVPFIMINKRVQNKTMQLPLKTLSNIAPFILTELNLPVPKIMHTKD